MKNDLEYYVNLPYKLSIIPDLEEGGYAAEYPELPGCITCGESVEEVVDLAKDAMKCWLTVALENNTPIPFPEAMRNCKMDRIYEDCYDDSKEIHEYLKLPKEE